MSTLTLNKLRVSRATIRFPQVGAWVADVDVDLETGQTLPTGLAELDLGGQVLRGTIDPASTGAFGLLASARLVGHRGGWWKAARAQQHHNDAGVRLSTVLAPLAAEVGEVVTVSTDEVLGIDYVRRAGVASQALEARAWYTDLTGATIVGPRVAQALPAGLQVLSLDLSRNLATVSADGLVLPGMVLVDDRLDGGRGTVGEVVATYEPGSSRFTCSIDGGGPRLQEALQALTRDPRAPFSRVYRYRVVGTSAGRHDLQAIRSAPGLPDALSISAWPGLPGLDATPTPAAEVLVGFIEGDPARPYLAAWQGPEGEAYIPRKIALDATEEIRLGGLLAKLVAHAEKVDANLTALQVKFDAHTHVVATTGTAAAQTGTAAAVVPTQAVGPLPSCAASKTFAE